MTPTDWKAKCARRHPCDRYCGSCAESTLAGAGVTAPEDDARAEMVTRLSKHVDAAIDTLRDAVAALSAAERLARSAPVGSAPTRLDAAEALLTRLQDWITGAHHRDKCARRNGATCDCGKHELVERVAAYYLHPPFATPALPKPAVEPLMAEHGIPRRNRVDLFSPAERAIHDAIAVVESAGAHERLTDAVILLGKAQDAVADFVDATMSALEARA